MPMRSILYAAVVAYSCGNSSGTEGAADVKIIPVKNGKHAPFADCYAKIDLVLHNQDITSGCRIDGVAENGQ